MVIQMIILEEGNSKSAWENDKQITLRLLPGIVKFYLPWRGIGFLQYSSPFSHNLTLIHLFFENIVGVCGPTLAIIYYFDYIIK